MARKRTDPARTQHVEPGFEDQDAEQQAPEATEPDSSRKMSKTDAIRAAVAGGFESPGDGVDFIRRRFGIEMSKQHFSATKSKLKSTEGIGAKKGGAGKATAKRKPGPVEGYLAPPERPAGGEGDLLELMESMKPMIAQHGADKVKRIVDLLG